MKLSAFLDLKRIDNATFARQIGVSRAMVSLLRNGKADPSLDTMKAIAIATAGAVTADDFFDDETLRQMKDGPDSETEAGAS